MFCKSCGTEIPKGFRFCPNCGIETTGKTLVQRNRALRENSSRYLVLTGGLLLLFVIFLSLGIWIGGRLNRQTDKTGGKTSHLFDTGENGGRNDLETAAEPIIQEEEQVSLTGTWKCGEGEVIFTESGSMMLGLNSIVLGGGWVQYEVVDTRTLHITGGGLPVGMNISYTLDGDYLSLELNDTTITFTKK